MRVAVAAIAAVCGSFACDRDRARTPPALTAADALPPRASPDGPAPVPAKIDVTVTTNDVAAALTHGAAEMSRLGLLVSLADRPIPCPPGNLDGGNGVSFLVPHGPGGRFFSGRPLAIPVTVQARDVPRGMGSRTGAYFTLMTGEATVSLAELEPPLGDRVEGTISFDSSHVYPGGDGEVLSYVTQGAGSFAVNVCPDRVAPVLVPDAVPEGPVRGSIDGKPFTAATVHATLGHEAQGDYDEILSLLFYREPDVACVNDLEPAMFVMSIGGADSKHRFVGVPLPASASGAGVSWIQLDELELVPGARLRGKLYAGELSDQRAVDDAVDELLPGAFTHARTTVAGGFEATVCGAPATPAR